MKVPNSRVKSPDLIKNQEKINISDKIYDDEFVLIINGLNESIKVAINYHKQITNPTKILRNKNY